MLICSAGGNCGGWWEALQKGRHIFREGLGKGQPLPGDGVAEGELRRVQGRPPDQPRILPAIEEVPHQGMAQPGEMDPDLVSSPGLQLQTEQGNSLCLPYCLVPGAAGFPSGRTHCSTSEPSRGPRGASTVPAGGSGAPSHTAR